jgi:PIN domain nuclease of toxin-antitoxin system
MKLLLDTHAFLGFILNDPKLSRTAAALMADPANELFISPATYWEIAIKVSLGKYALPGPFGDLMDDPLARNSLTVLPITVAHAAVVAGLPFHHRDPFDRLLAAQALAEGIALVSADAVFDAYGVARLWH